MRKKYGLELELRLWYWWDGLTDRERDRALYLTLWFIAMVT